MHVKFRQLYQLYACSGGLNSVYRAPAYMPVLTVPGEDENCYANCARRTGRLDGFCNVLPRPGGPRITTDVVLLERL